MKNVGMSNISPIQRSQTRYRDDNCHIPIDNSTGTIYSDII